MEPEEIQKMLNTKFATLDKQFKDVQAQLQEAQKNGASKEELDKLVDSVKKQGQALDDFIESQKQKEVKTVMKQFDEFLQANKTELENIKKNKNGVIEFIPKAVGAITTGSGTDAETPNPNLNTQAGDFNLRNDNDLLAPMNVSSTSTNSAPYTEYVPKDGNYAFVAEGAAKPQIDFKYENRYPSPKKVAAFEILTEEAVTDFTRLRSIAESYLRQKHDLFKVSATYFADGTGDKPTGATVYGRTFAAGGMALGVTNPNFMDVVNACITDIYTAQNYTDEMEYMANMCLINPTDFYLELVSAKDANGLPLYPQAGLFNSVTIGGITIRPWSKVPAGKIFVADMSKYNLVNYIPFSIRVGFINDQFITNQFTILGESRFFQYVKNLDQNAFIYDDMSTIKTAIATV